MQRVGVGVVLVLLLGGCGPSATEDAGAAEVRLPPPGAVLSYQLGGPYDPPAGTGLVVRDSTVEPLEGTYSVCYLNAFQTQPGVDLAAWDGLLLEQDGEQVRDPAWPDEALLDTGAADRRQRQADLLDSDLERCAAAGFDAVELDNLDSFTRSGGLLEAADNLALADLLVRAAHARGLAVAQKNLAELVPEASALGLDLAVVEECAQFEECEEYAEAYGGRVYAVEYTDAQDVPFEQACERYGDEIGLSLRDRDLVPAGEPDHVERTCA